ncbi:hypothetical protein [Demequina sp.]|uniref:hypothetical protein n=1 Tax=Demequina sp. TaxID=2050685 RepID=UPI003D0EB6C9
MHELSGTCSHDIGGRAWNTSGSYSIVFWYSSYGPAVVPSGTLAKYKIYHEDASGN